MSRVKVVREENGQFPYYIELWDKEARKWKAEVRYYEFKQDVKDYPDVEGVSRNFRYLVEEDEE